MEKISPIRGNIFTSDNFPIVQNQTVYSLSLYKPDIKISNKEILDEISKNKPNISKEDVSTIQKFDTDPNIKWVTLTSLFTQSESDSLKKVSGLVFDRLIQRFYPENNLAKNILGFIAKNDYGQIIGYEGLEGYYNKQLTGKVGYYWQAKDAQGKTIMNKNNWLSSNLDGRELHTSLNRSLQFISNSISQKGLSEFQADSVSVTILEPKTGDVLAMTHISPTESTESASLYNPPISKLFEPGSIFKPIVVSMALDKKSINTNYICTKCNQPLVIGEYTITNWNNQVHPDSTLKDIIKNSDNIGMSHIIKELGLNNFLEYYKKIGLTNKTGIDLQGEARPQMKNYWSDIDLAAASFGQGIALTQLQMVQIFNTIANDGILVTPHLVQYYKQDSKTFNIKSKKDISVFRPNTTDKVKEILKYAVENGVIASMKPANLEVCAKSGTAQVAVKGGYTDDRTIASYIGFSPCNNPKFTMIVTIDNPRTSPWGAQTAAPIWYDIATQITPLLKN